VKLISLSVCLFCLLFSNLTLAHVSLASSAPAKGEVLSVSPAELALAFSGNVRVVKVVLKNSEGKKIDFGFTPPKAWSKKFSWPVSNLPSGTYQVNWVIMGKDGHKMKGSYEFIIQ
jgi:methionine-rich copper-binding protein CopC